MEELVYELKVLLKKEKIAYRRHQGSNIFEGTSGGSETQNYYYDSYNAIRSERKKLFEKIVKEAEETKECSEEIEFLVGFVSNDFFELTEHFNI